MSSCGAEALCPPADLDESEYYECTASAEHCPALLYISRLASFSPPFHPPPCPHPTYAALPRVVVAAPSLFVKLAAPSTHPYPHTPCVHRSLSKSRPSAPTRCVSVVLSFNQTELTLCLPGFVLQAHIAHLRHLSPTARRHLRIGSP